jgi:hypothetical protein
MVADGMAVRKVNVAGKLHCFSEEILVGHVI